MKISSGKPWRPSTRETENSRSGFAPDAHHHRAFGGPGRDLDALDVGHRTRGHTMQQVRLDEASPQAIRRKVAYIATADDEGQKLEHLERLWQKAWRVWSRLFRDGDLGSIFRVGCVPVACLGQSRA